MSRHTNPESAAAESAEAPGSGRPRAVLPVLIRIASGAAAASLLLAAERLPIWRALFSAPQYPHGLDIAAYGNRVEGDLGEINELSHYIGMPPFNFHGMPEMRLWPLVIAVGMVAAVVAAMTRRRWLRRLACTSVWLIPVGALADVQFRLWQVGHSLASASPIHVTPFTPRVVGPTTLMNFTVHAFPGTALVLVAVAAALVTSAPFLARRATRSGGLVDDAEPTDAEVTVP
jgi:copper chaperone NosL